MGWPAAPFLNVTVVPTSRIDHGGEYTCGGPVWPEWDARSFERHCRNGKPVDQRPKDAPTHSICDLREAFWGGIVDPHFGHQIADFLMRIIPSRYADRNAKFLFSAGAEPEPQWFWDLLKWCNVERRDVLVVRRPVLARQLRVMPQSEQLWGLPPTPEHLDLMDRFVAAKPRVQPEEGRVVYVSRAGISPSHGRLAGESYIESCISKAGGIVFRPETASVEVQMNLYRSSRRVIFSEGSALHLLQLGGRSFNEVYVLERRPRSGIPRNLVEPRCRQFASLPVTPRVIATLNRFGERAEWIGIGLADPDRLMQHLREVGCDIAPFFRSSAFKATVLHDISNWMMARFSARHWQNWRESYTNMANDLRSAGFLDLADKVVELTHRLGSASHAGGADT